MHASSATKALEELLSRPEGTWSPAEGALAIARLGRPGLAPEPYLRRLDELGRKARERVGRARHPRFVAGAVASVLLDREGFRVTGTVDAPEHCFLDRVLDGAPATPTLLALVFIEVARRCGFRFDGVGMPGRFLLRRDDGERPFLFDPLDRFQPVDLARCAEIVHQATGGRVSFREGHLRPITASQLLARIAANLKAVYWRAGDYERALTAVQMILTIRPGDPREIRDRGRALFLLGRFGEAIESFETYLAHNPRGEDADVVRMLLQEARAGLSP
ncbi:MAG: hypothetical protein D6718_12320 [Acidobacteria bacterium]|nr:MAG: hypothetical protein D6718_12320 [Acidobacteriota bacterium]